MVNKYKKIRTFSSIGSAILVGATSGVFGWYLKHHNVDNYLISITSGAGMALALSNLFIKNLKIDIVEKMWYINNLLIFITLFTINNPYVFIPISMLFIGLDHILYDHVESHYLDQVKNKLNIRNLNSDLSTWKGVSGIIAIPLALAISNYYSDILYALVITSYIILDVIVVTLYRKL